MLLLPKIKTIYCFKSNFVKKKLFIVIVILTLLLIRTYKLPPSNFGRPATSLFINSSNRLKD